MHAMQRRHRHTQTGFTLAEVLVASAIFTVIIIAALLIYDRSNQVFKSSSESIDLQQNTRVAFNKLSADLRMAGFDYDRDGIPTGVTPLTWAANTNYNVGDIVVPTVSNGFQYFCTQGGQSNGTQPSPWPTSGVVTDNSVRWQPTAGVAVYQQPDEQIEYAGQTALTIRSNFDYDSNEVEDRFNGRETALEAATPQFPVITTGNDEIVTYALSKPATITALASKSTASSGCTSTSTNCVHFFADVNSSGTESRTAYPGGNTERAVDIAGLDLTNSSPPYTLYRITLAKDGSAVYTPVADNIRSLRFKYYEDTTGSSPLMDLGTTPVDVSNGLGGDGQYDPNASGAVIADRLVRGKIKSIQMELIGMIPYADKNYVDPNPDWTGTTDTVAPNTRKVTLSTLIVPRNLGKRGQRIQSIQAPQSPIITKVCVGYCGLAQITWSAPTGGGATGYNILYDTSPNGSFQQLYPEGLVTTGYVPLSPNVPYYFRIQALNDYGSGTSESYPTNLTAHSFVLNNATIPSNPTVPVPVTPSLKNEIDITWNRPTTYTGSANTVTCDPTGSETVSQIPGAESITYNVWRGTSTPVNTAGTPYISYTSGAPSTNVATGVVTFKDTNVANCVPYYYAVQAVKPVCEPSASYYSKVPHSGIVTSTAAAQSTSTLSAPAAPSDLTIADTSTSTACVLQNCTVSLSWPRVTRDTATPTANPIVVDAYEITRTQKLSNVATTAAGNPTTSTGTSNATFAGTVVLPQTTGWSVNPAANVSATDTVPQTDSTGGQYSYEYKVRAYQCSTPGAGYSPVRVFPCASTAGTVQVAVAGFSGSGSSADPWLFDSPVTVTATSQNNVSAMHLLVYSWNGTTWVSPADLGTQTGPRTSATWSFSSASFGTKYLFDVSFTDTAAAACTVDQTTQGIMESTNCCLRQLADDPLQTSPTATKGVIRGFSAGTSDSVDVFFENICGNALPIATSGIVFTWDDANLTNGTKISSIEYPSQATTGTGVAQCSFDSSTYCYTFNIPASANSKGTYTAPTTTTVGGTTSAQNVPANATTYRMRVKFSKQLPAQPINSVIVKYLVGVTTTNCSIVP